LKTGLLNARINDGKGNQVLRSSKFPGQWGSSIPPNLEQEKRNQKARHHHSNNKQKESEIVSKFQEPQETLKGSNERMNIGSKSNRRSRDVEDMMGHHPKGEDHAKNVVPNWRSSVYHEPPPDTRKATISFAALSLKETSIRKRAMERKGRNKLKQERAMAIATVERNLGLMQHNL
jgi:hypothetical protein